MKHLRSKTGPRMSIAKLKEQMGALLPSAQAHCDGPCGIYDPASARVAAEAVRSMTKKILGLKAPDPSDPEAVIRYHNTLSRYVAIKEEQAEPTKRDLLILCGCWREADPAANCAGALGTISVATHLRAHPHLSRRGPQHGADAPTGRLAARRRARRVVAVARRPRGGSRSDGGSSSRQACAIAWALDLRRR